MLQEGARVQVVVAEEVHEGLGHPVVHAECEESRLELVLARQDGGREGARCAAHVVVDRVDDEVQEEVGVQAGPATRRSGGRNGGSGETRRRRPKV